MLSIPSFYWDYQGYCISFSLTVFVCSLTTCIQMSYFNLSIHRGLITYHGNCRPIHGRSHACLYLYAVELFYCSFSLLFWSIFVVSVFWIALKVLNISEMQYYYWPFCLYFIRTKFTNRMNEYPLLEKKKKVIDTRSLSQKNSNVWGRLLVLQIVHF